MMSDLITSDCSGLRTQPARNQLLWQSGGLCRTSEIVRLQFGPYSMSNTNNMGSETTAHAKYDVNVDHLRAAGPAGTSNPCDTKIQILHAIGSHFKEASVNRSAQRQVFGLGYVWGMPWETPDPAHYFRFQPRILGNFLQTSGRPTFAK